MTIENPPAFPFPEVRIDGMGIRDGSDGMSLRDWFAGQVLAEVNRQVSEEWDNNRLVQSDATAAWWIPTTTAKAAYAIADAMLRARSTPDNGEGGQ